MLSLSRPHFNYLDFVHNKTEDDIFRIRTSEVSFFRVNEFVKIDKKLQAHS